LFNHLFVTLLFDLIFASSFQHLLSNIFFSTFSFQHLFSTFSFQHLFSNIKIAVFIGLNISRLLGAQAIKRISNTFKVFSKELPHLSFRLTGLARIDKPTSWKTIIMKI